MINSLLKVLRLIGARFKMIFSSKSRDLERQLTSIQNFHVVLSDVINKLLEENKEALKRIERLEKFTNLTNTSFRIQEFIQSYPKPSYVAFENAFRGDEVLIKNRQQVYVNYYTGCSNVLDIGCGRGEFLELLRKHDISASGIDLNEGMVNHCKQKELKVICSDMFDYLLNVEVNCFDGVFSAQVIEHLDLSQIHALLYLLSQKVKPGAIVILETVNPMSSQAHQHFYTDLTHVKPIFPDVIIFWASLFGFSGESIIFSSPTSPDLPLIEFDKAKGADYADYAVMLKKNI